MRMVLVAAALFAGAAAAQPLELLTEENRPLNYSRNGQPGGTAVLVVQEMLKRAALDGRISVITWDRAYGRAQREKQACVFATVRTPDREKLFQWVGPVSRGIYSVFALESFPERIDRVDDLKAWRVATVNDARAAFLRESGIPRILEAEDDAALPLKLTVERDAPDGAQLWMTQAWGAVSKARAAGVEVKPVFRDIMTRPYWLACNGKQDRAVIQKLNAALDAMRKDGTYSRLSDPESLR